MVRGKVALSDGTILKGNSDGVGVEVPFDHNHGLFPTPFSFRSDPDGLMTMGIYSQENGEIGTNMIGFLLEQTNSVSDVYASMDYYTMLQPYDEDGNGGRYAAAHLYFDTACYTDDYQEYYGYASFYMDIEAHRGKINLKFDVLGDDSSTFLSECTLEIDLNAMTGVSAITISGGIGSYLAFGYTNVWLEGSYMPPRFWGILASAPATDMIAGDMYYDSATSKACFYTGAAWVNLN
jgi:hypothetical protein